MKCEIIRDLLPLYEGNVCSEETRIKVEQHLRQCEECRNIYSFMKEEIVELEEKEDFTKKLTESRMFWEKYYGRLILQGLGIFGIIYILLIGYCIYKR